MAHGGGPDWNQAVKQALEPVRRRAPTALALGMADPKSLQAGLDTLAGYGVDRVIVVRLFLSGSSFLQETKRVLGIGGGAEAATDGSPTLVGRDLPVITHTSGVLDSPRYVEVLRERVLTVSHAPERESVLLIAHGMETETDDQGVLARMRAAQAALRDQGFARVESATLREDWPEKRVEAEAGIRAFVRHEESEGRRVLVVPVRLFGFGPYASVLEDLPYVSTPALLPHPAISAWITETAAEIACREGWAPPAGDCGV